MCDVRDSGLFMRFDLFIVQLEKHKRADQDLKKRVLKLEFCLQEARAQTRKLHRVIVVLYFSIYTYS